MMQVWQWETHRCMPPLHLEARVLYEKRHSLNEPLVILLVISQSGYGEPPAPVARVAEPPKPKAPLPQRYLHIQTTFEDLKGKCSQAAQTNPVSFTLPNSLSLLFY